MDPPSRGFHLPCHVDRIHEQSVPYGWGRCQRAHAFLSFHPRNQPMKDGCLRALKRRERDATSHVEPPGNTQSTRRTDCPQDSESQTVCLFAPASKRSV